MSLLSILFYAFSTVAIVSGVMVITARNSVHSILFLVLAFIAMAGIWVLLSAEFLALILVLVYVGAVMTLFLFVVMMLNLKQELRREGFVRYLPIAAIVVLSVLGFIVMVVGPARFGLSHMPLPALPNANYSNTADLGSVLYTNYAYPFEVAGVLLLSAIIAAITLSHRAPKNRKIQHVWKQIAVRPEERVKLVSIDHSNKVVE